MTEIFSVIFWQDQMATVAIIAKLGLITTILQDSEARSQ